MLRICKLTDYGTVVIARMAREPTRVFAAPELAEAVGISPPTTRKILKTLTRAALLRSVRGTKGGYSLARPAPEISLVQVIDAFEGPLSLTECGAEPGVCALEARCAIRGHWLHIDRLVRAALDQISLVDMAQSAPSVAPPVSATTQRRPIKPSTGGPL